MSKLKQYLINAALDKISTIENSNKIIVLRGIPIEIIDHIKPDRIADIETISIEAGSETFVLAP